METILSPAGVIRSGISTVFLVLSLFILLVFMNFRTKLLHSFFYDSLFKKLDFSTVLDVGCGSGKMKEYFESRSKAWTGFDLYPKNDSILKGDFLKNDLKPDSYDLVFSAHLLEHIPLDKAEFFCLENIRVAKKFVCCMTPAYTSHFWDQYDHVRPYNRETLKRIFHVKHPLFLREFRLPFFEPVNVILFDVNDSALKKV